jgi:2'-5' RNA ligase
LTLKFLGDSDTERLDRVTDDLAPRVRGLGVVTAELAGGGFFPSVSRPRVAWVGGSVSGSGPLVEAVEESAERAGYPRDTRPWVVHLTMARLKSRWPRAAVERYLGWADELEDLRFVCPDVVLFESDLQPGGAVYTALERMPLG